MKLAATALIFAVAVAGCSTSPSFGKPNAFRVGEIRREIERLSGHYTDGGKVRNIGGGDALELRRDGTFAYNFSGCTRLYRVAEGDWHPYQNRIEFDFHVIAKTDAPAKWLTSGLEIVGNGSSPLLYPLDPSMRREIARKPSVWPLRKYHP